MFILFTLIIICFGVLIYRLGNKGAFGIIARAFPHKKPLALQGLEYEWVAAQQRGHTREGNGFALVGVDEDALVISNIVPFKSLLPTIKIPKEDLEFVDTKQLILLGLAKYDRFYIGKIDCWIYVKQGRLVLGCLDRD